MKLAELKHIVCNKLDNNSKLYERDYSKLKEYLLTSEFFSTPAAAKHHNNFPGGLALHVLNFSEVLEKLILSFGDKIKINSDPYDPFLVALGHDLNKVGFYSITDFNKKIDNQWVNLKQYGYNSTVDTMPSNYVSLQKMKDVIKLSKSEELSIYWAEGSWSTYANQSLDKAWKNAIDFDHRVYLAHSADMISSQMMENVLGEMEVDKAIRGWIK